LATLKLNDCSLQALRRKEIKFVKKQAKKVEIAPKGENGYGEFTEMQAWSVCRRKRRLLGLPGGELSLRRC